MRPRCAVCGIGHESNSFSTLRAGEREFRIRRGDELLPASPPLPDGVEWVPLLHASAGPYGHVELETYEAIRDELLDLLHSALPLDGVLLRLHGAMEVDGLGDGETDLVRRIRSVVGEDAHVAGSLDLHANVSPELVADTDCLTAYREAPHTDAAATWARAARHAARALTTGLQPRQGLVKLPMILPGEWAVTSCEPAQSIYGRLGELDASDGVLDASLLIGCAWTDSPHTSVSALVVSEGSPDTARRYAEDLAAEVWDRRGEFGPESEVLEPGPAIEAALSHPGGGVFLSDTGDNPGAGAAGDLPIMLGHLLEAGASGVLVGGLRDEESTRRAIAAGAGARTALEIGGKLDTVNGAPLGVDATVERTMGDRLAVVSVGGVTVVLSAGRIGSGCHEIVDHLGMDLDAYQAVVVKCGYLYGYARERCRRSIWALTPGWTDVRLERLPYQHLRRPVFPLDDGVTFALP